MTLVYHNLVSKGWASGYKSYSWRLAAEVECDLASYLMQALGVDYTGSS